MNIIKGQILMGGFYLKRKEKKGKNKFYLHIMRFDNDRYIEQLIFRDALRANARFAKAYEAFKLSLREEETVWYSMGKLEFLNAFFGRKNGLRL